MATNIYTWWTDDRIEATVNRAFVNAQLTVDEQKLLEQSFGGGLTDDTYLEWILDRAKKLFLILVDIGIPDQIFGLVDESYDDADLPIASSAVQDLRLAQDPDRSLDKKFYKAQFKFLIRHIQDGEHMRYTDEETIPVETVGLKAGIVPLGKEGTDKVRLPPYHEIYARKRVTLNQPPRNATENDVLSEVSSLRRLAHQHLVSIYASYSLGSSIFVLLSPAAEYTLKSFITDTPKAFESLSKPERREILINWPHCLANGLEWLHDKGLHHGAVRPTNVFVDTKFRIFLGQFDGFDFTHSNAKVDEVESYQYAAPEKWKRAATTKTSVGKVALPSGGRTGRKQVEVRDPGKGLASNRTSWDSKASVPSNRSSVDTLKPKSPGLPFLHSTKGSLTQLRSDQSSSGYEASINSSSSSGTPSKASSGRATSSIGYFRSQARGNPIPSVTASVVTADTSGSSRIARKILREPVVLAPPELRTTIVQTWHSAQYDPLPADIFALGAIISDILTLLCKRTSGAFSRHRSAKNRTAGRGGGLADASFHANIGQVHAWLALLVHDAKKKSTKDDGRVFRAVEPMVEIVKACIEREPEDRIRTDQLEEKLGACIWQTANVSKLHCYKTEPIPVIPKSKEKQQEHEMNGPPVNGEKFYDLIQSRGRAGPSSSKDSLTRTTLVGEDFEVTGTAETSTLGPESSYSSLSSFNFEYDLDVQRSDDGENGDKGQLHIGRHIFPQAGGYTAENNRSNKRSQTKARHRVSQWDNFHNNDSTVDPSLATTRIDKHSTIQDDTSGSDKEQQMSFLLPESRPASIMPVKSLEDTKDDRGEMQHFDSAFGVRQMPTQPNVHLYEQRVLPARPTQHKSSRSHQPNTSKTCINQSTEMLQPAKIDTLTGSDVEQPYLERRLAGSASFSRPRTPQLRQAHEPGKSYLKNV